MDGDKSSWILDFILRQPLEDWLAKELLLRLTTPPFLDPHLKKALFLRQLSSDRSAGRFSEATLQSLELLEELDRSHGATAASSQALKAAYCAVAVELTASTSRLAGNFKEAVHRMWNCRIADLERSEARGLAGEQLREWKKVIEAAATDDELKLHRVFLRDTRREALQALGAYLNVAFESMDPSLLELMAGKTQRKTVPEDAAGRVTSKDGGEEIERAESIGNEKEQCADEMETEVVKEALQASCAELQKAVSDPLPEALVDCAEILNTMRETRPDLTEAAHEIPSFSLMERNSTARTHQWTEDSLDSLSEKSGRIRLPTPRVSKMSPLALRRETKFSRRRRMKKWTAEEENVLRKAVDEYGTGRWKFILQRNSQVFEDRTEVDLKDKWRNLSRYRA